MEDNLKQRGNPKGLSSKIVASQVRKMRSSRGLDLAGLSKELKQIGWPISVAALSRLENRDRRIDVDDLVAISAALDVSPLELLFTNETLDGSQGTGLPGELETSEVWAWATDETVPLSSPTAFYRHWRKIASECEQDLKELEKLEASASDSLRESVIDPNRQQIETLLARAKDRQEYWRVRAMAKK